MFVQKTAWFSSSVLQACHDFWNDFVGDVPSTSLEGDQLESCGSEGGMFANWKTADYLFSDDAACPDTLRVFESKDYRRNKVTVFHSLFLSTCEKRRSTKSACIGHYVLPPAPVQEEVRKVIGGFIWESADEEPVTQVSHKGSTYNTKYECCESDVSGANSGSFISNENGVDASVCNEKCPVSKTVTGYVIMDNLQKYSGDLQDLQPSCYRCANCNVHCCLLNTPY